MQRPTLLSLAPGLHRTLHDVARHLSHDDVFNISCYGFTFHKLLVAQLSSPGPTKAVRSSFNTYNVMRYTVGA